MLLLTHVVINPYMSSVINAVIYPFLLLCQTALTFSFCLFHPVITEHQHMMSLSKV